MRGRRSFAFAAAVSAILISPVARAATELHGGPGFADAVAVDASAGEVRSAAAEGAVADAWASAVDEALFRGTGSASPSAAKADRFSWTFLLIAFAGLTALFAGKRTAGRGLNAR
jgi:hypothetical protein